jgi:uncharacterized membrane protein
MSLLVQWFYLLALCIWVGGIIFFSFFTTPVLFSNLPKEMASQVIGAIFPRYYSLGYFCGGTLLVTTLLESLLIRHAPWVRLILILIMLGSTVYAGTVIRPKIHELKVEMKTTEENSEIGLNLKTRFDKLHRFSVILNLITLVGGLFLVGIVAFRLRL